MKFRSILALSAIVLSGTAAAAAAQTQNVTIEVQAVNQIAFTGSPSLVISAAAAGSGLTSVSSTGASYAVTTNQTGGKITAQLDAALPSGVTLSTNLTAPTSAGTSAGAVVLNAATATDVVTALSPTNQSGITVLYTLAASPTAGVVAPETHTITYTIIAGT
jgi:hypothetical protein